MRYNQNMDTDNIIGIFQTYGIEVSLLKETSGAQVARCILKAKSIEDVKKFISVKDDLSLALESAFSYTRTYISKTDALEIVVELPKAQKEFVYLTEELKECKEELEKLNIPLVLGRDLEDNLVIKDITETGSFLISGSTGTGKSVFIESVIYTLLKTKNPSDIKFVIIEPKMGFEIMQYEGIPYLLSIVGFDTQKSYETLTKLVKDREKTKENPKNIVVLIDEFASLMSSNEGFEEILCKIAKQGEELGIYILLSTSKPSNTVFTEKLTKCIPNRIAFALATKEDSTRVIGEEGGETLTGNGDMIYMDINTNEDIRIQAPYVSYDEVETMVKKLKRRECLCKNPTCAKCLLINCKDEDCKIHTQEKKKETRQRVYYPKIKGLIESGTKITPQIMQEQFHLSYKEGIDLLNEFRMERGSN